MRPPLAVLSAVLSVPGAAQARVGHPGDMAGHDHRVAGASIVRAIAPGLRVGLKRRRGDHAEQEPGRETVRGAGAEA